MSWITGKGAPPEVAIAMIDAAVFVCSPIPRRQIANVIEKIPALNKKRRRSIVIPV
jgi:hypothetical protein